MTKWLTTPAPDCDDVHVVPLADLTTHRWDDCVCGPSLEAVFSDDGSNGWMITHHSLDRRERQEKA